MQVSQRYFATFEFTNGNRRELEVSRSLYGVLAEQDQGQVSFTSDLCRDFQRQILR